MGHTMLSNMAAANASVFETWENNLLLRLYVR